MNSRLLAVLIIFPIWLIMVLVFRKHRQWLLYYLVASFGLTLQLVLLIKYLGWDQILVNVASFHVDLLTKYFTHIPIELLTNGRFQITLPDGSNSILKLGIECSAVLESSIVLSLIVFYPLFNPGQKLLRVLFGLIVTYVINIMRLMIIVLMAYRFGSDYIFIAHAGVARIFFFLCELTLYWYLMTKPSVKAVGESIEEKIPLSKAATVGNAFKIRYAMGQILTIIIFAVLVGGSFVGSNEWRVALAPAAHLEERSSIYTDEAAMEVLTENQCNAIRADNFDDSIRDEEIIDNFLFEKVPSQDERIYTHHVTEAAMVNLRLVQSNQPLEIEVIINGKPQFAKSVQMGTDELILDKDIFNPPLGVNAGDNLEFKIVNIGKNKANYIFEIISGEPCE